MRNSKWKLSVLALAAFIALLGCHRGGGGDEGSFVDRSAAAMGGSSALLAVQTQQITASGQWFEPEESFRPGDPPLTASSFQYTLTQDMAGNSFRYDWAWNILFPSPGTLTYSDVINGNQGFVSGQDTAGGAARAGMPPVRVATLTKFHRLTSPLILMRDALNAPESVQTTADEEFSGKPHHVITLPGSVSPVRIFIDPDTFLPAKADTVEDDPYYGDTLYEVMYEDWRQVGAIMVPFKLTQRLNGLGKSVTLQTEVRSDVQNSVTVQPGSLDIPADLLVTFDQADAQRGEQMSQWFLRRQMIGLPTYADQSRSVVFTESSPGSGVWHVTGGTHHSLVVVMADHLIVVEPPLYESRSQAVIAETKSRFPGKPIRAIVVTHFHIDHGGGVRAYAAEGATVVTGAGSQAHFEDILVQPHTVVPDALQKGPKTVTVAGVPASASLTFTDGVKKVGVFPIQNSHSEDMVIVHVSGENLVFVSDLFSPTSAGPVALTSLPQSLQTVFTNFGLTVSKIAGGHGTMAAVQ